MDRTIAEVARYRGWELHACNVRTNHVHAVVGAPCPPERVMNDLKAYGTRRLVETGLAVAGQPVWARHGSTRYVWDRTQLLDARRYVLERQ